MKIFHLIAGVIAPLLVNVTTAIAQDKLRIFDEFDTSSTIVVDNNVWSDFLATYVVTTSEDMTLIKYGDVTEADHSNLKSYIETLIDIDPTTLNKREAFVYWVNLYNAVTVDIILDDYPVKSIRNIFSGFRPGPWLRTIATIKGTEITLDNIEHGILRKFWRDNRVHYAVNCASIGCPNLRNSAYVVEGLDDALDEAARSYVNHPRGFRVEKKKVIASSIYNWFKDDFGGTEAGIIAHLTKYAEPELRTQLERRFSLIQLQMR